MATNLLKEINEKMEILNRLLGDEDYINKLEKKIVKPEEVSVFKYVKN